MPPIGGFFSWCSLFITLMKLNLWGTSVTLRIFERVETSNSSYAICDIGVEYEGSTRRDGFVLPGVMSSFINPESDVDPEKAADIMGKKRPAKTSDTPDQEASSDDDSSDDEEPAPEPEPVSDEKPASEAVVAVASHDPDAAPDLEDLERSLKDMDEEIARLREEDILSMSFT